MTIQELSAKLMEVPGGAAVPPAAIKALEPLLVKADAAAAEQLEKEKKPAPAAKKKPAATSKTGKTPRE